MNCLEKYRGRLIRDINRELQVILQQPDEEAVHEFRVGIKRLTALYRFLHAIDPSLDARQILKPYRKLYKPVGRIRDAHIAAKLLRNQNDVQAEDARAIIRTINNKIRRDYRNFQNTFRNDRRLSIRTPSIRSTGISEAAILRSKRPVLDELLQQFLVTDKRMGADAWHRKRIVLKRYHHVMDAFQFCPGHQLDENEIKQIRTLEQLLGDWHDRVATIELLESFPSLGARSGPSIRQLKTEDRVLLSAAKIYLRKFQRWHQTAAIQRQA